MCHSVHIMKDNIHLSSDSTLGTKYFRYPKPFQNVFNICLEIVIFNKVYQVHIVNKQQESYKRLGKTKKRYYSITMYAYPNKIQSYHCAALLQQLVFLGLTSKSCV